MHAACYSFFEEEKVFAWQELLCRRLAWRAALASVLHATPSLLLRRALHAASASLLLLLQVAGGAAFAEKLLMDVCGDACQRSVLHGLGFQLGVMNWQRDWEQRYTSPATPPRELEAQVSCAALMSCHLHGSTARHSRATTGSCQISVRWRLR